MSSSIRKDIFKILKEEFIGSTPEYFYHGSPYEFSKFDIDKVGTGDGLNKYGFGLYFSDNKEAAEYYARELSIGDKRNTGFNLYTVKLAGLAGFYNWEEPVVEHLIECVSIRLNKMGKTKDIQQMNDEIQEYGLWTMRELYQWLLVIMGDDAKETTRLLNMCDVNGVIADDAMRGGNIYVAFSDDIVKIIDVEKINNSLEEDWKKNLAAGLALTAGSFGALKGQNVSHAKYHPETHQTSNQNIDTKYFYSAILGYLDQHGEELVNNSEDKIQTSILKKEVMKFCENKRDGNLTKKLSREGIYFFEKVAELTKNSGDVQNLIQIGLNIKHPTI